MKRRFDLDTGKSDVAKTREVRDAYKKITDVNKTNKSVDEIRNDVDDMIEQLRGKKIDIDFNRIKKTLDSELDETFAEPVSINRNPNLKKERYDEEENKANTRPLDKSVRDRVDLVMDIIHNKKIFPKKEFERRIKKLKEEHGEDAFIPYTMDEKPKKYTKAYYKELEKKAICGMGSEEAIRELYSAKCATSGIFGDNGKLVIGAATATGIIALAAVLTQCPKSIGTEKVSSKELYNRLTSLKPGDFPNSVASTSSQVNNYMKRTETLVSFDKIAGSQGAVKYARDMSALLTAYTNFHQSLIDYYIDILLKVTK